MAQVSGIEVKFSADTSDLDKGIASAGTKLQNFSKLAAIGLAGLASAAAAGGVAIGALTKQAINFADEIGKTAQKIGMTSESLSKLEYAAKLSDVSLGQLQVGLGQLSKNMQSGNDAFTALGINVTNAQGYLRSTEEVLLDVAERFAGMQDGAGKTALAMQIFGRSGADLIPMLNAGRDGIAQMTDEASRFGLEISSRTSKAAEGFNDNLTRITSLFTGLANTIAEKSAPRMKDMTDKFIKFVDEGGYVQKIANLIDGAFAKLAETMQFLNSAWEAFTIRLNAAGVSLEYIKQGQFANAMDAWAASSEQVGKVWERNTQILANMRKNFQARPEDVAGLLESAANFGTKTPAPAMPGDAEAAAKKAAETSIAPSQEPGTYFTDRLQTIRDQFATERELLTQEYELNQQVLDNSLLNERIKKEEHTSLMEQLEREHQNRLKNIRLTAIQENLGYAADFMGSMVQIAELGGKKTTKIAKVFGIAQALISTFQGAAKALTLPFPANMAAYAQVLAQGLTAVASIKKVSENGGSNGAVSGGGRGGAVSGGAAAAAGGGGGGGPTTTFQFTLMNDPMGFGEKFARQFIDQLNSTQRNGGQIRGVIA